MNDVVDDETIIGASSASSHSSSLNTGGDEQHDSNDSNIHSNNNKNDENNYYDLEQTKKSQLTAILILLTVPAAWGTYAPAVKYIYDVAPSDSNQPSMPGLVFSAGYYCVAALTLGILSYWRDHRQADDDEEDVVVVMANGGGDGIIQQSRQQQQSDEKSIHHNKVDEIEYSSRGGWELGSYLFIGNALQVAGLQTVPADRAGEFALTQKYLPFMPTSADNEHPRALCEPYYPSQHS